MINFLKKMKVLRSEIKLRAQKWFTLSNIGTIDDGTNFVSRDTFLLSFVIRIRYS